MSPTPAIARPALGLGWQARAEGECAPAPTGAPQPSVGLGTWTAQPTASLSDATAKYQTTSRAFPEIWCPPAELQACN